MVNKFYKMLLIVLSTLLLFSCSQQSNVKNDNMPEGLIFPETTVYNEKNTNYVSVAENKYLKLSYNENTANFMITNKADGSIFKTITDNPATPTEKSLIEINYVDDKNNFATYNSFSNCISKGQFKATNIDNGVKIEFTFGDIQQNALCPPAISVERFESFLSNIKSNFDKNKLKSSYFIPNLDKISEVKKQEILKLYPNIQNEKLYILTQTQLPLSIQKEIERILISAGYTQNDYEIDKKNVVGTIAAKPAGFHVNMYVTIEEKELKVKVPVSEIMELNGGKIISISFMKNLASPEFLQKGKFLLPDGTGSIMNFYNGKGDLREYQVPIYGRDLSVPLSEIIYKQQQAYLPIFASIHQDKAMLGVIDDGDAISEVKAFPGTDIAHAVVYPNFILRQYEKTYLSTNQNDTESFIVFQKKLYDKDLSVSYHFFEKGKSSIGDIALYYSNKLFNGIQKEIKKPAIYLEFIGASYKKKNIMSVQSENLDTFTTIEQVREITEDLLENDVGPLVIKLTGFGKGGIDTLYSKDFKLNKELATNEKLNDFTKWAKNKGVEVFLDVDPQYVYKEKMFDGFSKVNDVSYLIAKELGRDYPYHLVLYFRDDDKDPRYILNPSAISNALKSNADMLNDYQSLGLSIRNAGNDINSTFKKNKEIDRQNAMNLFTNDIKYAFSKGALMTNGANAPILRYSQHVMQIDMANPHFDIADMSAPFLQMVIKNNVGYSDTPVNLSGNDPAFILESLSYGAGFAYTLTAEPNKSFVTTNHPEYYSTQYNILKDDIIRKSKLLKELKGITDQPIINFEQINPSVYKITYQDGKTLICNHSDSVFTIGSKKVNAYEYLIGG